MSLVLIGSGPGIGLSVAKLFATKRFAKVALLARNQKSLDEARDAVVAAASSRPDLDVRTYAVDITDEKALEEALLKTEKDLGPPECVYFNAARVAPSSFFDSDLKELELDFKVSLPFDSDDWDWSCSTLQVTTSALYVTAKWAIPLLKQAKNPAFLVTNSLLYKNPLTFVVFLTITKTSQRSLVQMLDMEFGKEVHIGLINVDGEVGPQMKYRNPTYIAEKAWEMYDQEKGKWDLEVTIQEWRL
jgi:NAD(P)-dependent dehydrogenase (short-subunit alcohol dehydrogenase family)